MKVIMFTGKDCPNCKRAKMLFERCPVEVELIEIDIESKEGIANKEILGFQTLPTFDFGNDNFVYGFDEGKIRNLLGL